MMGRAYFADLKARVNEIRPTAVQRLLQQQHGMGRSTSWTVAMYVALRQVGHTSNRRCFHKRIRQPRANSSSDHGALELEWTGNREIDRRDITFLGEDGHREIVVEHENARRVGAIRYDFTQLWRIGARLRVIIGYRKLRRRALVTGQQLVADFSPQLVGEMPGCETLLVMGWQQQAEPRGWHAWLHEGQGPWQCIERDGRPI
jgi:hypothetical protein